MAKFAINIETGKVLTTQDGKLCTACCTTFNFNNQNSLCPSCNVSNTWAVNTEYKVGDKVGYGGSYFFCKTAHTSNLSNQPPSVYWTGYSTTPEFVYIRFRGLKDVTCFLSGWNGSYCTGYYRRGAGASAIITSLGWIKLQSLGTLLQYPNQDWCVWRGYKTFPSTVVSQYSQSTACSYWRTGYVTPTWSNNYANIFSVEVRLKPVVISGTTYYRRIEVYVAFTANIFASPEIFWADPPGNNQFQFLPYNDSANCLYGHVRNNNIAYAEAEWQSSGVTCQGGGTTDCLDVVSPLIGKARCIVACGYAELQGANACQSALGWQSGINYSQNDIITYGNNCYCALIAHTSSSSNRPPNVNYWVPYI